MSERKRYIVYPGGAHDWAEIKATFDLLNYEGANPKIVKYNGRWNVEAQAKEAASKI